MSRLASLEIDRFRSIEHAVVEFPRGMPVVLFGQNNAGKSNIIKALSIVLGETYPRYYRPDENDYFLRDLAEPITIVANFPDDEPLAGRYAELRWEHDRNAEPEQTTFNGFGRKDGGVRKWPSNEEREECMVMVVEAERNLKHQLSYTSKYTMLSKLMHKFHKTLHQHPETKKQLEVKFEETKTLFEEVPEFVEFNKTLRGDFHQALKCWTYKLEIDFEAYNPLNFFHSLRVQAKEGDSVRPFEELGTGEQQILAMAFGHAYARAFKRGFVLAIEEPEVHLHPLAQAWLAERIRVMCADGLQVILSTHSPSFLNLLDLPGMYLVCKDGDITRVIQHDADSLTNFCVQRSADAAKCRSETVLPFYSANTTPQILEGFFARAALLVEGPTEALALPIYLAACGCDTKELGIAVIPVHGKGSIARYIRLFKAYQIPTYAVFDNDPSDDQSGKHRRDILRTLGQDIKETYLKSDDMVVEDYFAIFGEDFEKTLRKVLAPVEYISTETSVRDKYGPAKPIVARETARELVGIRVEGDCWRDLLLLAQKISALISKAEDQLDKPEVT